MADKEMGLKKKKKKYVKRYIRKTPIREPFIVRDSASDSPYFSIPEKEPPT
jgi:hypothetical protein